MRHLTLHRKIANQQGTFGRLSGPGLSLCTYELPWNDNLNDISCIPPGTYRCVPHSGKYKNVYRLLNIPWREGVLIHIGNTKKDSTGCILVGRKFGKVHGVDGVQESALAMEDLRAWAGQEPFMLTITDETGRA